MPVEHRSATRVPLQFEFTVITTPDYLPDHAEFTRTVDAVLHRSPRVNTIPQCYIMRCEIYGGVHERLVGLHVRGHIHQGGADYGDIEHMVAELFNALAGPFTGWNTQFWFNGRYRASCEGRRDAAVPGDSHRCFPGTAFQL